MFSQRFAIADATKGTEKNRRIRNTNTLITDTNGQLVSAIITREQNMSKTKRANLDIKGVFKKKITQMF